jgi:hypothetical protein
VSSPTTPQPTPTTPTYVIATQPPREVYYMSCNITDLTFKFVSKIQAKNKNKDKDKKKLRPDIQLQIQTVNEIQRQIFRANNFVMRSSRLSLQIETEEVQ